MILEIMYFVYAIAMAFIYFVPGFLVSLFFKKLNLIEKITISFFFSTLLLIIILIAYHYAGFASSPLILIPYLIVTLVLFFFARKQFFNLKFDREAKLLLILFFIIFIAKVATQIFIKYYPAGTDYVGHYKTVLFFLGEDWKLPESFINMEGIYLPYRTPGFYMLLSFFLYIFGNSFWVCQLAATLVNTVFILPAYCIARHVFNKKIALLTILFVSMIPFVETSLYMHAKMLVAYFSFLLFYIFITKKVSPYLIGAVAGMGLMIHQSSFIFILAIAVPYFFEFIKKRSMSEFKNIIKIAIAFLLVVAPWFIITYLRYGSVLSSSYNYFPIYTTNYGTGKDTPEEIWANFKKTSPLYIVGARVVNTITFATPIILVFKIIGLFFPLTLITGKTNPPLPVNFASNTDLPWAYYYYHSLSGILTMLMFVFAAIGFLKLWRYNKRLFYFVFIPVVFTIIWYGWVILAVLRSGVPEIVPILVMVGFWEIFKRKNYNKILKLVFALAIIELIVFAIFYSWHIDVAEQIAKDRECNPKYPESDVTIKKLEQLQSAYKLFGIQGIVGGYDKLYNNNYTCPQ